MGSRLGAKDPTGKKLGDPGAKMDAGKDDLVTALEQFPNAIAAVSEVCKYGAEIKGYGWSAWRDVPDGTARYKKALVRHVIGPEIDEESGLDSLAHAAWNALAILEFEINKRK